jgi:type I restriction enzyme S subunit
MYIKVGAMNLEGNENEITTSNLFVNSNEKIDNALIPSRSIIFPKRGGAIATNKKRIVNTPILVDLNTMAITCPLTFDFMYLRHWFSSIDLWELNNGTSVPQINNKDIAPLLLSLPPLEEQKAIVSVVNQLFAEVEQLEALTKERIRLKEDFVSSALQQLTKSETINGEWAFLQQHFSTFFTELPNIKKLRESILQLAVQGKLTTHWRKENPELVSGSHSAKALLERIKTEKAQLVKAGKIKKEKALPKITAEEIPYELPEGWVWCRLGELTELITKGSSPKWQGVQYVTEGEGVLFVTSENVGSYKLLWNKKKYVEWKFNEIEPRSILKRNDLLMNIVGGSIGRTAIYDIDDLANINQAVTIIRLLPKISFAYFLHFFNSPTCISYMYEKQVDNARPNLSMGNISKFMIPFPSIEEQKAIVEKVNILMALCDQLEQEIQTSKATQEDWMKSSLREVFSEAKPTAETKTKVLEGGELGMVAEPGSKYNN